MGSCWRVVLGRGEGLTAVQSSRSCWLVVLHLHTWTVKQGWNRQRHLRFLV
jgi:hypothetical protein